MDMGVPKIRDMLTTKENQMGNTRCARGVQGSECKSLHKGMCLDAGGDLQLAPEHHAETPLNNHMHTYQAAV